MVQYWKGWYNERIYVQGYFKRRKEGCRGRFKLLLLVTIEKYKNFELRYLEFKIAWPKVTNEKGRYRHCILNSLTRSLLTKFGVQNSAMEAYVSAVCITSSAYFRHRHYNKKTRGCFYVRFANLSKGQLHTINFNDWNISIFLRSCVVHITTNCKYNSVLQSHSYSFSPAWFIWIDSSSLFSTSKSPVYYLITPGFVN
jgi:hypothetical protein